MRQRRVDGGGRPIYLFPHSLALRISATLVGRVLAEGRVARRPAGSTRQAGGGVCALIETSISAALSIDRQDIFLVCLECLVPKLCFARRVAAKTRPFRKWLRASQIAAFSLVAAKL